MEETHSYSTGDWIVHSHYGVGQIKGIEVKSISGKETRYYKIETTNSTFWVPVDQMDSDILRPLSTPEEIEQAIATLERPAREMSPNYKMRQINILGAQVSNTPTAIARILRDLRARRRKKGVLNSDERSAFRNLKQRLIEEWVIVTGAKEEIVMTRLNHLLDPDREPDDGQTKPETPQKTSEASSLSPSSQRRKWGIWPKQ